MATDPLADTSAPNLNLTAEEKRVYGQLFRLADSENVGVVTGDVAVKFFERTRLDMRILGEIWQIADKENRGFLTPAGFGVVLRLIGHAQAGREPAPELALQQAPLPRFEGFTPALSAVPATSPAVPPMPTQATTSGPARIPPLTPEKVAQYTGLFERQKLQNGNVLPGDQAKQIFEKSGLPNEILGRIWMLADTEQRGALVLTEFVIAMHLLTSMKLGTLRGLPTILPATLYEAATRRAPTAPGLGPRQPSPATGTPPPLSTIPRQLTGQAAAGQLRAGSPLAHSTLTSQPTDDWAISPVDKARFDQLYSELDKSNRGYITGEEVVPFFSQSNLSEDILAQIWDLADISSEGRLNRDTFAIAMYLIRQQRSRRDGQPPNLPSVLPPNFVPPSMRAQVGVAPASSAVELSASAATLGPASVAAPAPNISQPQPNSHLDDLFGLDAVSGPTDSTPADPFAAPASSPSAPSPPLAVKPSPTGHSFKFVPSSSFGLKLTNQPTGGSNSSAPAALSKMTDNDLLSDADPDMNKKLTNDPTELANLSNQITSLSKQVHDVQNKRNATQTEFGQASAQKRSFESRLAQLRAMCEKEDRDVRALEAQLAACRDETRKIQGEAMTLEGTHQDLQAQHRTLSAALQADQQENNQLKERIRAVNAEIAQLKPLIEKLKSEARQQKGLVAINKKQLLTSEGERDRLRVEADDLVKGQQQPEDKTRQAAFDPAAQVASPAPSTASANNPFFRRTSTDLMANYPAQPQSLKYNDKSFDDVFGPSDFAAGGSGITQAAASGSVGSFASPPSSTPTMGRPANPAAPTTEGTTPQAVSTTNRTAYFDAPDPKPASRPASKAGYHDASTSEASMAGQSLTSAPGSEAGRPAGAKTAVGDAPPKDDAIASSPKESFGVKDQEKAKHDFETAFAGFRSIHGKSPELLSKGSMNSQAFSKFSSEFPPISSIERDMSDSDSERGGIGFEDDFTPASPAQASGGRTTKPGSPIAVKTTSSEAPESQDVSNKPASPSNDMYGSATPTPSATTASLATTNAQSSNVTPGPSGTKTAFDDLGDDFEDLDDAKEGSADDDFASITRQHLDDFNPVFDSSPLTSQARGGPSNTSSYDFASLSTNSNAGSAGPAPPTLPSADVAVSQPAAGASAQGNHDWDALFAGLTSADTASSPPPPGTGTGGTTGSEGTKGLEHPSSPGRALSDEGEHDDPILKNLTGRGYARDDALSALEKYNYNLEKATNYLASR